jgi:hypothetical protein
MKLKQWMGALAATAALISAPAAHAVAVNLELVLLADVSGSLDATDFNLQRQGYSNAFRSAAVQNAITQNGGAIAVTLVYWSAANQQSQSVAWTLIDSAASAIAFADAIDAAGRPFSGNTAMSHAMTFANGLFDNNGFESDRATIDVSGDGADSTCGTLVCAGVQAARDAFMAGPGTRNINALWIDDRNFFGDDPEDAINAYTYGTTNVLAGPTAFQILAQDFDDFQGAVITKLEREIIGGEVPEPATLALLGLAIGAAGVASRRSKR